MFKCTLFVFVFLFSGSAQAAWSLTDQQRRAFLEYYSPIIFKRANGNGGEVGRDWISNYDFDRDFVFKDNKREWRDIGDLVSASAQGQANARFQSWNLRPTLYTSLIEYMDGGQKHLVLTYQVYYPFQENAFKKRDIHDFERIEIHIKNINTAGQPNRGERAQFAIVTQHKRSVKRGIGSPDYNFFTTSSGKHLMLWQSEHTGKLTGPHGNELRFVEDSWAQIQSEMSRNINAEVEIIGTGADKNVHYIFVPNSSAGAVSTLNAKILNYESAHQLASHVDNGKDIRWRNVKRVQYELQDMVDINSTNWANGPYFQHWLTSDSSHIFVNSPFKDPQGRNISSGLQLFYLDKADVENGPTENGILGKSWFWGNYEIRDVCDISVLGLNFCLSSARQFSQRSYASTAVDSRGNTRASANGDPASASTYWHQHDYFVHSGTIDNRSGFEHGFYLTNGWATPARGGFDGRWVNLFPDNTNAYPSDPLRLKLNFPTAATCREYQSVSAIGSGGRYPYTFTWRQWGNVIKTQSGVTRSSSGVYVQAPVTVMIRDADGQTLQQGFTLSYQCGPGQNLQ